MKALARAVVETAAFIELADDSSVDEDDAVRALEVIASHLGECSPAEKAALRQALKESSRGATRELKRYYGSFMSTFGLDDEPEESAPPRSRTSGSKKKTKRLVSPKTRTPPAQRALVRQLQPYADAGDKSAVAALLAKDPALANVKLSAGDRPLHLASLYGHAAIVRLLLAAGARVDAKNNYRQTPLHQASLNGHKKVIELLVAAGADVNARDSQGETPLTAALDYGAGRAAAATLRRLGATR